MTRGNINNYLKHFRLGSWTLPTDQPSNKLKITCTISGCRTLSSNSANTCPISKESKKKINIDKTSGSQKEMTRNMAALQFLISPAAESSQKASYLQCLIPTYKKKKPSCT